LNDERVGASRDDEEKSEGEHGEYPAKGSVRARSFGAHALTI
jgi:hypothetical protein